MTPNRPFLYLDLASLFVLWEELTIHQPYTRLLTRYAEVFCTNPDPKEAGDLLTLEIAREMLRRGIKPPIPDWVFGPTGPATNVTA